MPNHYHLVVETPLGHLRQFMRELNGRYGQTYNLRHRRVGPLFQGRYKAALVEADTYALALVRYVHLNPVWAGLCETPQAWPWSSGAAYLGIRPEPVWLTTELVLSQFAGGKKGPRKSLQEFTMAGRDKPEAWKRGVLGRTLAGSKQFIARVQREFVPVRPDGNISRLRELRTPPAEVQEALERRLAPLVADTRLRRHLLWYALHMATGMTEREIASLTKAASAAAVAQAIRRIKVQRTHDIGLARVMKRLDAVLRGGGSSKEMSNVKT